MAGNKKTPSAQYAFIGLIIAGLAGVTTILAGAAKGMIAIKMFPEDSVPWLDLAWQISLALFAIGLLAYVIMVPDAVRRFLTGRQARYGSNSLILTLAFVGIIVVVNYLVFQNPKSWDMTEDKSNTLADETLQALATLPDEVTATGFYSASLNTASADELLTKFKDNSDGKFDYKFVDPDLDPVAAREAGITGDGKIMLQMGDRKEIASYASEDELTKTLIRLISPTARVVYFLEGHGEATLDASGGISFSTAKSTLEAKNYTVNPLNLLAENKIPEDALAIIVAGPTKPVFPTEVDLLKKYMDAGGSLVVMEDPTLVTEFDDSADPLAEYLTKDWGITLDDNIVIDLNSQNPFQAVSLNIGIHPITQNLTQNYIVVLPQARSLSIAGQLENITLTPLILTTEQSWGETELVSGSQPQFDPEKDTQGPLNLAIAGENSITKGRVVVFGNSIFTANDGFDAYGNGNMFINSVDWAAEQEDLINFTPRERTTRMMEPISNLSFIIMIITTVLVLPGFVVFAGVSAWLSRRKRG